jgi:predicted secreted protein
MKKLLLLCAVACLLMCCTTTRQVAVQNTENQENEPPIEQQSFTIKKGETFEISMLTNASIGMRWEWVNSAEVRNVDSTAIRFERIGESDMVGSASRMYWSFTGIKKGTSTLQLEYGRFFSNSPRIVAKIMKIKVIVK